MAKTEPNNRTNQSNELVLQISNLIDTKLSVMEERMDLRFDALEDKLNSRMDSLESELRKTNILIENDVLPRLNTIEKSYTDSYFKYKDRAIKIDSHDVDISAIKTTVIKLGGRVTDLEAKSANA